MDTDSMGTDSKKRYIPWAMAAGRTALGPVLIAGAECGWSGLTLAGLVVVALVSDIYDGVLARRWGCDTAGVRLFDSMADTVFYLCTAVALWVSQPQLWRSYGWWLAGLLGMEAVRFGFDFVKFRKPASYHSYLAKAWGLVMAVAVVGAFAMHRGSVLVPVALGMGILCDLEGLAMSVVMPMWRKDVKSFGAALRIRRDLARVEMRREMKRWRERRRVVFTTFLGMVMATGLVTGALAMELEQVASTSGSGIGQTTAMATDRTFKVLVLDALNGRPQSGIKVEYFCEAPRTPFASVFTDTNGLAEIPFNCKEGTRIELEAFSPNSKEECGGVTPFTLKEVLSMGFISKPDGAGGIWCPTKISRKMQTVPGQVIVFIKKPTWWQSHIAG